MTMPTLLSILFANAFLAATLLPVQSELLLATLLVKSGIAPALLILVASIGNILGSCVNWWLGTRIEKFKDRKWFPASPDALSRAQSFYHRHGRWSLLLAWLPVLGDPITVMAGVMRERLKVFILLVGISKILRYCLIYLATLQYFHNL